MRYIETDTIFGFSNRYLGIPLMNSGPSNLARWVGHSKATEIILRDLDIAADEAIEIGLATKCVPNGTGELILDNKKKTKIQHFSSCLISLRSFQSSGIRNKRFCPYIFSPTISITL